MSFNSHRAWRWLTTTGGWCERKVVRAGNDVDVARVKVSVFTPGLAIALSAALIAAVFFAWPASAPPKGALISDGGYVSCLAFHPDGRQLATADHFAGRVTLWDLATLQKHDTFQAQAGPAHCVAFSPDGSMLAAGFMNSRILGWDLGLGREAFNLRVRSEGARALAFSPSGRTLASGTSAGAIELWDPANGWLEATLGNCPGGINALAFSPDCRLLASGSSDNALRLWDLTGRRIMRTIPQNGPVSSVAFGRGGRVVACVSQKDPRVRLWDVDTGAETMSFGAGEAITGCVAFAPDGSMLAFGGQRGTVTLCDLSGGRRTATVKGHKGWVWTVAFSPSGGLLASSGNDGTVRLWNVEDFLGRSKR
jgi:WD40 repeat protein